MRSLAIRCVALVSMAAACARSEPVAGDAAPVSSSPVAAKPAAVGFDAATSSPEEGARRAPEEGARRAPEEGARRAPEERARQIVTSWSNALDRHDIDALALLYAPKVKFYGKDLPRSAVLEIKRRALGPSSTFRQTIVGTIEIAKEGDAYAASFLKRSGTSTVADVRARVVIVDQHVREESDAPSEARSADARRATCEAAAIKAVNALPAVAKLLEEDKKALEGKSDRHMGGLGPIPNDDGGFSGSLGFHHPERYEAQVWYEVDAKGKLTVTILGADEPVPPASKTAVERACKGL